MQVTPRLPVHGPYINSSYVEMRYFRFGDFSLPAALLFSLAEHSFFPHFSSLQVRIPEETKRCGKQGKGLLALSTSKEAPARRILAAWNSGNSAIEEVIHAFELDSMNVERMVGKWRDVFHIQVVKYGNERTERPDMDTIYWNEGSAGCVVLLYREYAPESFVVLDCGHVYSKAALYRKAREAMQRPLSECQMSAVTLICGVEHCLANLSKAVFSLGKRDAAITPEFSQLSDYELGKCKGCARLSHDWICRYNCAICLSCAAAASLTKHGLCCLQCGHRYRAQVLDKLTVARRKVSEVKETELTTRCRQCQSSKPLSDFKVLRDSTHKCWICDICLLMLKVEYYAVKPVECAHCKDELSITDQKAIWSWQNTSQDTGALRDIRTISVDQCCILCSETKGQMDYSMQRAYSHSCQICDKCFQAKIKPIGKCLLCSRSFPLEYWGIRETGACAACHISKQSSDFQISFYLNHSCVLCNSCILLNIRACQSCFQPFSDKDAESIQIKARSDLIPGPRCLCGNLISTGSFFQLSAELLLLTL